MGLVKQVGRGRVRVKGIRIKRKQPVAPPKKNMWNPMNWFKK